MKPEIYIAELKTPVENPGVDRRCKGWNYQPEFLPGIYRVETRHFRYRGRMHPTTIIRPARGGTSVNAVHLGGLLEALEPVEVNSYPRFRAADPNMEDFESEVLDVLVREGIITLDDIRGALDVACRESDLKDS